jgi:predicted MFS family arabinose efflux permease
MLSQLVILDYAAQITPKEAEAFTFAGLCSIINLGSMGSGVLGGWLYPQIGLSWLIIISGVFTLFCLFFIPYLKLNKN